MKLRRNHIVVDLEQKVYVYNFADSKLLNQIEMVVRFNFLTVLLWYESYRDAEVLGRKR